MELKFAAVNRSSKAGQQGPAYVEAFEAHLMAGRATVRITPEGLNILRAVQPAAAKWAERTARPLVSATRGKGPAGWMQAELPTE